MTDLERSPFVPSHIEKARRTKQKEQSELAYQRKIIHRYDSAQMQQPGYNPDNRNATKELLNNVSDDIQVDSLENRISIGDLAAFGHV